MRPDYSTYPLYQHAHRLEVTVEEGEVLYLPSLWFHHVEQEHSTIAGGYSVIIRIICLYIYTINGIMTASDIVLLFGLVGPQL